MDEKQVVQERKDKILKVIKEKYNLVSYLVLAVIVFISIRIRSANIPGLKDITTGGWALGPDLDPWLFLRWAKYIAENGSLMAVDSMRYVPLGFNTGKELLLHPYMMAWFHNVASMFGSESVTQSAVYYPVFFFAITVVAFFFLVRKIFVNELGPRKSNIVALVSSFFLVVAPSLLPRTIAGIPEKESAAFFFLFAAFYFFLSSWKSEKVKTQYIYAVLAGLFTAGMALVWGGFIYLFVTIGLAAFISFLLGKVDRKRIISYAIWIIIPSVIVPLVNTDRTILSLVKTVTTGFAYLVLLILVTDFILFNTKLRKYVEKERFKKIAPRFRSLIIAAILGLLLISLVFGPAFITSRVGEVSQSLIKPKTDRLGVTVAENRQPYFSEWSGSFGPVIQGIPLFFWLFFLGSIYLFYTMMKTVVRKDKLILTGGFVIFLTSLIFSRYKSGSVLDGESMLSVLVYFVGALVFLGVTIFYIQKYYRTGELEKIKGIDFGLIFLFSFFFFSLVSARSAVRLIMVLVPSASIIASYFVVVFSMKTFEKSKRANKDVSSVIVSIALCLALVVAAYSFYDVSYSTAKSYVPSAYNQQWQKAMSWVRENTPEDAVFGHWWDYGYWVQSIGERATVLDGGNSISYWNHFMGRNGLTSPESRNAAEFLFAHETTHFLIDSTDIGKYTAFSSIGSDENYDRRSWVNTFLKDSSQTFDTKNSTLYLFRGAFLLDEDITYEVDGKMIFLPGLNDGQLGSSENLAGLGAIKIEVGENETLSQPTGIFVYNNRQYEIPIRYAFYKGVRIDFGEGIEAGIFLYPRLVQSNQGTQIDPTGAGLYLSGRVVNSQLARLYLYGEEDMYFSLAHTEDDFLVADLKNQGLGLGDFIYFQGFRGPIKVWEIYYPGVELNEEYLSTEYPSELRRA